MLETIEALKRSGDITAINALIPYAQVIGLEAFFDEYGPGNCSALPTI